MKSYRIKLLALCVLTFFQCKSDMHSEKDGYETFYVRTVPEYAGKVEINSKEGRGVLWDKDSNKVTVSVIVTKKGLLGIDSAGTKYPLEYDLEKLEEDHLLEIKKRRQG